MQENVPAEKNLIGGVGSHLHAYTHTHTYIHTYVRTHRILHNPGHLSVAKIETEYQSDNKECHWEYRVLAYYKSKWSEDWMLPSYK